MTRNVTGPRVPVFTLGERITKARRDLRISQQQLADRMGVDRKTIGNWESNRVHVRYGDLMMLSSTLDVDLRWLAGDLYRPPVGVGSSAADADSKRVTRRVSHGYQASRARLAAA